MSIGNRAFGFGSHGSRGAAGAVTPPAPSNARLTESGDRRVTEAGAIRVVE